MTRRSLLWLLGAAAAACFLPVAWWRRRVRADGDRIADALAETFPYLHLAAGTVASFSAAYRAAYDAPDLRNTASRTHLEHCFLMSTDFFQHGGDERRELHFVALYGPYVSPCYSPFRSPT